MDFLRYFAAETTSAEGDIFSALGIDWRLLILQIIAFIILVVLLGKFVYPWLMKSVDDRQAKIEEASKAAEAAKEAAEKNQVEVEKLLSRARKEAAEIVNTAKTESSEMLSTSEKKAKDTAEQIITNAHSQIEKDVEHARKQLHNDTIELIALATEKVVAKTHDNKADNKLITAALKEVQ